MLNQFYNLKAKHPDALLLFRVGDFYECYNEDAHKVHEVLYLFIRCGEDHTPYVFFPHHALDIYLPRLIRAGYRCAICDQLEPPRKTVKRNTFGL